MGHIGMFVSNSNNFPICFKQEVSILRHRGAKSFAFEIWLLGSGLIGIGCIPLGDEFSSTDMEKDKACRKLLSLEIEKRLKNILRFKVTPRTLIYIEKRLGDVNSEEKPHETLQKLLTQNRLLEFKTIFQEILNFKPFTNLKERNIDVINSLNFGIFYELQGKRVAHEGLRAV